MNAEIRPAILEDLGVMQSIARYTIDRNYRNFLGDEGVDWFISGPSDDYLSENINKATVIIIDGILVGFSVCKENLIDHMMVNHDSHRNGIGSILLQHCEEKLFEKYQDIKLESFAGNEKANNFYLKNGWSKSSEAFDEVSGSNKILFIKSKA
jgi:GNAT superfamily N-acetyltransferase